MPTRETAPIGAPCWVDLMTSDVEASRKFYSEVFGWIAEAPSAEFGGYFMFTKDGVPVAGGMPAMEGSGIPDHWGIYLAVEDARKATEVAVASGGEVQMPAMDVADLGTMVILADPTGASIGAWQPRNFHGFPTFAEESTPSWFELATRDYDGAVAFYREVFHWDTHVMADTPEFRYTTLGQGSDQLAGIMDASAFLPEGVPAHWSVYFGTNNTDASVAKITSLGGSVVLAAEDTPYGRLATVSDPTGALFKLVSPNTAASTTSA